MEDFSALAARIAVSVPELRGCIILTRDGLDVGSYPPADEGSIKRAWLRFAALGDPGKGFVEFSDELWVYVRRGPYAVFALAAATVRPGLMMDQLDQLLLVAEESRSKRETLKVPEVADAPKGKPRTPLHKETGQAAVPPPSDIRAGIQARAAGPPSLPPPQEASERRPQPVSWIRAPQEESAPPTPTSSERRRPASWILTPQEEPPPAPPAAPPAAPPDAPEPVPEPVPASMPEAQPAPEAEPAPEAVPEAVPASTPEPEPSAEPEEDAEIDRVQLAQEFSRLIQDGGYDQGRG